MVSGANPPSVLITGAASGIGLACARLFEARGWRIHGLDRVSSPADLAVADWTQCDLAQPAEVQAAITTLRTTSWSALISCAGIAGDGDPARILGVNFIAARAIVDGLSASMIDNSAIVLMSSGAGMKWEARQALLHPVLDAENDVEALALATALSPDGAKAYEVSKELLNLYGLRNCLTQFQRGVRINVISPGGVDTPLTEAFTRSMGQDAMDFSRGLTGRFAKPEEIAEVALFLASPQAAWVNGAEIRVDGGLTGALSSGAAAFPKWA